MKPTQQILFPPFHLDFGTERLWRGEQEIRLRPKTFAVLRYLIEHPGRIVTKEDLLTTLWPKTFVSEVVPMVCMRELRQALGDEAKEPRFIETVHRRGYRFIASLTASSCSVQRPASRVPSLPSITFDPTPNFVGRETELAYLQDRLSKALAGERQLVLVTGELGVGKTALVGMFLQLVTATTDLWSGWGQCLERYGAGEAYMPVLQALGRACQGSDGKHFTKLLGRYAPSWLVQASALLSVGQRKMLQRKVQRTTRDRMLRELADALEVVAAERPVVLWFEDLQWSDVSTLEWLAFLAQRRERARLLVIGTCQSIAELEKKHPLRTVMQGLQIHRQCAELRIGFLSEEKVVEYLHARFPINVLPSGVAHDLYQCTEGNPLFLVDLVDNMVTRGLIIQSDGYWALQDGIETIGGCVPEDLRQMIEQQIERLSREEQEVLEVASVTQTEFSAAAVAAGLEVSIEEVEERCEGLVRRGHFLRANGLMEWPDGTVAACYAFIHLLYQQVLYDCIAAKRRMSLHRRIGERKEAAYGDHAGEIAAELAIHFERGREYPKAVRYLQQAAENALQRSASQEALAHLTKGLELLRALPDAPERSQQALLLQISLNQITGESHSGI